MDQRSSPPASPAWIYAVMILVSLVIFGVGLCEALLHPGAWTMLAAGCVCLVGVAVTWPIAQSLHASCALQDGSGRSGEDLHRRIERILAMLERISDQQLISERARSVAFREKDREAIRLAINEELGRGEWEAAFALADQFEKAFGSRAEADRFRADITRRRNEGMSRQIGDAMAVIDRHTRAEQWSDALAEAEKLQAQLPNNEQVKRLPQEIENRRRAHKAQLLQSWHEATARHDNDGAVEILKQLDLYLTPAEAETMQETVRGVFKERLNSLAAQFVSHCREHRPEQAIQTGEQIQREFPNSRIAQEVGEKLPGLRAGQSGESAGAGVPAGT